LFENEENSKINSFISTRYASVIETTKENSNIVQWNEVAD